MMLPNTNYDSLQDSTKIKNEDPLTGERGAHPLGTGIGAVVGGAAVGAAAGSLGGPVGTVAGTIAGGFAGAVAGRAIAESLNPTFDDSDEHFWRQHYPMSSYYSNDMDFESYRPAYQFGRENYTRGSESWEEREPELKKKWEATPWETGRIAAIPWEKARLAARDAFERMAALDRERDDLRI